MTRQHTVVLARAVSYASGRIAVIRCIPPCPPLLSLPDLASPHIYIYIHAHTRAHTHESLEPSFLKFDRIRNGARYLPTRISRTASLFGRIYCPWIIGSPRRMIGYTKFDSPHRLFFAPRSIPATRHRKEPDIYPAAHVEKSYGRARYNIIQLRKIKDSFFFM